MPGRRRGGMGGLGRGACPRRISRFLEPCLLALLRQDASHGYNLVEGLGRFGFAPGMMDSSVVYRILREMEAAGLVSSAWDTTGAGPPRRVYTVTRSGEDHLGDWLNELRLARDEIDDFIDACSLQPAGRPKEDPESPTGEEQSRELSG